MKQICKPSQQEQRPVIPSHASSQIIMACLAKITVQASLF